MSKNRPVPYLLLLPSLALVGLVAFYPVYYAVDISLYQTQFLQKTTFVGLGQYTRLLHDPDFLRALGTSLIYAGASLALTLPIGMIFALLLNRPIRFKAAFRTILIIPWTLSQTVTGMLWLWLLNPSYGPVKYLLDEAGFGQFLFLSSPDWALAILVLVNTWMTYPLPTILFQAALQTVPQELYESAKMDGCTAWASFWRVTLPFIQNTVMTTAIMTTLHFFNMVTLIYVMTGGGPLESTQTLSVRVFLDAFANFRLAGAAAVGMVIFFLNIIFSLLYIRVLRRADMY
ncbi:MAG: carbohydrate ABC transporter permease [Casimicrobiaceae bacterium]